MILIPKTKDHTWHVGSISSRHVPQHNLLKTPTTKIYESISSKSVPKLKSNTSATRANLRKSLSDKRPSVFRRVNVILGGSPVCNSSMKAIKEYQRKVVRARRWPAKREVETPIAFSELDLTDIDHPHNDPLIIELQIGTCEVTRVLVDTGSSIDLIFRQTLIKMMIDLKDIKPSSRALTGFNGSSTTLLGTIRLNVLVGGVNKLIKFSVIDTNF
ncbi:hypothetical protein N665_0047s0028 [Sinapis alba]|nr:hypothetical protein N665_0047s0028 [Sinapis alba]